MKTIIDPTSQEIVELEEECVSGGECPVPPVYTSKPLLRLTGAISVIRSGRRDFALSDEEWQNLGLEDVADAG